LSHSKDEFEIAYSMLCDKLYKPGGLSFKRFKGTSREAEDILSDLLDLKRDIESTFRYATKEIYRMLKLK
jgi:hypothetical protein